MFYCKSKNGFFLFSRPIRPQAALHVSCSSVRLYSGTTKMHIKSQHWCNSSQGSSNWSVNFQFQVRSKVKRTGHLQPPENDAHPSRTWPDPISANVVCCKLGQAALTPGMK